MASLVDWYHEVMDLRDRRVDDWPLMNSPIPILTMLAVYNFICLYIGPKLMENRPAYNPRTAMIVYNVLQIFYNTFTVFEAFRIVWLPGVYSWSCQSVDFSENPVAVKICIFVYSYFLNKALDLVDTIFMVLRKKEKQISFLHLYHHNGMVMAGWIGARFLPGGSFVVFFGTVNCFVHSIMYTYYLITIFYPEYKKSIWWKKHITELQIIQFIITIGQSTFYIISPTCEFPKVILALFCTQDVVMLSMFWDFYKKNYLSRLPCEKFQTKKLN